MVRDIGLVLLLQHNRDWDSNEKFWFNSVASCFRCQKCAISWENRWRLAAPLYFVAKHLVNDWKPSIDYPETTLQPSSDWSQLFQPQIWGKLLTLKNKPNFIIVCNIYLLLFLSDVVLREKEMLTWNFICLVIMEVAKTKVILSYLSSSATAKMCLQSGSWMKTVAASSSVPKKISVIWWPSFLWQTSHIHGSPHNPRQTWRRRWLPHGKNFPHGMLHLGRSHNSPHSLEHL